MSRLSVETIITLYLNEERVVEETGKFEWSSDYVIGVETMDDQHKVLIEKINDLVVSLVCLDYDDAILREKDLPSESFDIAIFKYDDLSKYIWEHFQEEEAFMESIDYAGIKAHKSIHRELLTTIGKYRISLEDGTVVRDELFGFLEHWLKNHIMGTDSDYAQSQMKGETKKSA